MKANMQSLFLIGIVSLLCGLTPALGQTPALQAIPACGTTASTYASLSFATVACYTGRGETVALSLTGTQQLVIKSGASITFSSFSASASTKLYVEPGATVSVAAAATINGLLVNYGTMSFTGNDPAISIANNGTLYNENIISTRTGMRITGSNFTMVNGGTMTIGTSGIASFACVSVSVASLSASSAFTLRAGSILTLLSGNCNAIMASTVNPRTTVGAGAGFFQYTGTDKSGNACSNPARISYYAGGGVRPFMFAFPISNVSTSSSIVYVSNYPGTPTNTTNTTFVDPGSSFRTTPQTFVLSSSQQAPMPIVPYSYIKYCNGATPAQLSATGLSTASAQTWYTASTGTAGQTTIAPTPASGFTGIYYVSQTVNGCEGPRAAIVIDQSSTSGSDITVSNNSPCAGSTLTLTGPSGYTTYQWTGPSGYTAATQSPTRASATTAMSGTYVLTVTQGSGNSACSIAPANTIVIVSSGTPSSAPVAAAASGTTCTQFMANWGSVSNATAYLLDVSTNSVFSVGTFVSGYNGLNVGNVTAYNVSGLTANTTYFYRLRARNACGILATNSNVITIPTNSNPVITGNPSNSTVCLGAGAAFTVAATGTSLTYQWQKGGSPISGATAASYVITSVVSGDANSYEVVVASTGCSAATSASATLTVNPLPSAPTSGGDQMACAGGTIPNLTAAVGSGITTDWYSVAFGGIIESGGTGVTSFPTGQTAVNSYSYYAQARNSTTGCVSTSRTAVMLTINALPSPPSLSSNTPVLRGSTINLTSGAVSGATYSWTGPNLFTSSSQNPAITTSVVANAGTYSATVMVSGCTSTASNVYVVVADFYRSLTNGNLNSATSWEVSSDQGTWVNAAVAPNTIPVSVEIVSPHTITVDAPSTLTNLTIQTGGTLAGNSANDLTIIGNFINNGGTFAANNSTVILNGSGAQTIGGTSPITFYNLTLQNAGAKVAETNIYLVNTFTLGGSASFDADGAANNKTFTIVSTSSNTGRIATLPTPANFTGNVTMQRYFTAGKNVRYISSPVTGATISELKTNTLINGPTTGGFDGPSRTTTSIRWYDESYEGSNGNLAWKSFTSTSSILNPGQGYYLFVPGDRTTSTSNGNAVTLTTTSDINKGNVPLNVTYTSTGQKGWSFVGNPYPSSINWNAEGAWTKTNIDNTIWLWDPKVGTTGAYYSYNANTNVCTDPSKTNPWVISSFQGFLVKGNAASPSLIVTENAKVGTSHSTNFRSAGVQPPLIRMAVSNEVAKDYTVVCLVDLATEGYDHAFDALKLINSEVNISIQAPQSANMSIQALPESVDTLEVKLSVASKTAGNHLLEVVTYTTENTWLIDDYLHDTLVVFEGQKYPFTITSDTGSYGNNRFRLVKYPEERTTTSTSVFNPAEADLRIYPNPTLDGNLFIAGVTDLKEVSVYNLDGMLLVSGAAIKPLSGNSYTTDLLTSLNSGTYMIELISGNQVYHRIVIKP
jgi:hypothetical protein